MSTVLAFDFGASSGRAIKATFDGETLHWQEVHRFENNPIFADGYLCWDFDKLMQEVYLGIEKAGPISSLAFDTWGVDFGLLDAEGKLLAKPVHYRDSRTLGIAKQTSLSMSATELYKHTGNQIMDINTLFQLVAMQQQQAQLLAKAKTLLFMPDLFAYTLCGNAVCERSIASTSQMLNPLTANWSLEVLHTFGLPQSLFAPLLSSGSVVGQYKNIKVIAVAGHDTQCAVTALPTTQTNVAFLSCGTWSLVGTELPHPILTAKSMMSSLSNEMGANGKINYLNNIIGLWLIQESRREWQRQGQHFSYAQLEELALEAPPFQSLIDPDAPEFSAPGNIPALVQEFCKKTGQMIPQTVGEIMRCIYQSLALKYRFALEQLSGTTGTVFTTLHILGGGVKDRLLCQMTANSCNIPVVAGPVEATALGNILIQLVALGELPNIEAGRVLIAKTQLLDSYEAQQPERWNIAYKAFRAIIEKGDDL